MQTLDVLLPPLGFSPRPAALKTWQNLVRVLKCLLSRSQPMSGGLHVHESGTEPQLWLHKLRHFQLGFPGFISPYDSGLLGKLVSISK